MNENSPFDQSLRTIRRSLHAEPELSGQEVKTASTMVELLSASNPDRIVEGIGGAGVMAIFDSGTEGQHVVIRAELDALPIVETNDFDYRSTVDGVSHKCGHDGHMTILIGLAERLARKRPERGKVALLFQPSEETGTGAQAVISDEKFTAFKPDYMFALHNLPKYKRGSILVKTGAFTASVKSMIIKLTGKVSHAAEPENGVNPGLPIAEIVQQAVSLSNNNINRHDFILVTPIQIDMGAEAYGVSAGNGIVRLTIRTWTETEMKELESRLIEIVNRASLIYGIKTEVEWTQVFRTTRNDEEAVKYIEQAAKSCDYELSIQETPFKWGEDFGAFTQNYTGAMFAVGAGLDTSALHNDDYDFPDEILMHGVNMFDSIIRQILDTK